MLIEDTRDALFAGMLIHHVLSTFGCVGGLISTRLHFYGCFAGMCELSTSALCIAMVMKGTKSKLIAQTVGLVTLVFYFVLRIVLFPTWITMFTYDFFTNEEMSKCSLVEIIGYLLVLSFLFVFSFASFLKLVKGHRKNMKRFHQSSKKED